MRVQLPIAFAAVLCLAACGTPGAPRPPSLDLPRPVTDLSATRVGDKVTLRWTVPSETTDSTSIRHPGKTRICRDLVQPGAASCTMVAELPPVAAAGTSRSPVTRTYVDQLPMSLQIEHPIAFANYAVVAVNDRGKSAGASNEVQVPVAPTLPPPTDVSGRVTSEAVIIDAQGRTPELPISLSSSFHLHRRQDGSTDTDLGTHAAMRGCGPGPIPGPEPRTGPCAYALSFYDRNFEWEKRYVYRVAAVTSVTIDGKRYEVQGEPSQPVEVFTHDIFPPAAPTGPQAVASGVGQAPFVDLSWVANTEADLAGYNVYRHEEGQPAVKINTELVKAPAFRDSAVTSGHKYLYAVSAVDLRGNESSHSAEAAESVP